MSEIRKAKKEWQELNNEAKAACKTMSYLRNRGEENSELYKSLFMEVSKLSDKREELNFKIEKLRETGEKEHGYL